MTFANRGIGDPLLAIVRTILGIAMGGALVVGAMLAAAVPAVFIFRDRITVHLSADHLSTGGAQDLPVIWLLAGFLLLGVAMAVLGFFFLRHLFRMIGTVGEGDPFVPVNALRLRAMAWISVAIHVIAIPMSMIVNWADEARQAPHRVHMEFDLPLSGLFLAMVLFILARVFREGTRLRDDLEGTV